MSEPTKVKESAGLESHDIAGWALRAAELELERNHLRERVAELENAIRAALEYVSSEAIGTAQQEIEENERMRSKLRATLTA